MTINRSRKRETARYLNIYLKKVIIRLNLKVGQAGSRAGMETKYCCFSLVSSPSAAQGKNRKWDAWQETTAAGFQLQHVELVSTSSLQGYRENKEGKKKVWAHSEEPAQRWYELRGWEAPIRGKRLKQTAFACHLAKFPQKKNTLTAFLYNLVAAVMKLKNVAGKVIRRRTITFQ